jgi:hypothetical protein
MINLISVFFFLKESGDTGLVEKKYRSHAFQSLNGSRAIGIHLSIENNRSESFRKFISGVRDIVI